MNIEYSKNFVKDYNNADRKIKQAFKETLDSLPDNGRALIISHDGPMVAAEKILQHKYLANVEKNYKPLEEFVVKENLELEYFSLQNKL